MAHTKQTSSNLGSKKYKGFTLVELIVVITILAILGTIGFLSIGGYSSKARDSARIGDAAQISKSLDLSIVTAGSYTAPDNAFSVTYSGGIVWYQGTIGTTVMQVFKSSISGGGLNKKPTDPLTSREYTYSKLAEGNAYQIKVDYEGDLAQTALDTSLVNSASAAPGDPTIAYIRGNYGGLTAKTSTGGILYVLAIPSIITNTGTTTGGSLTTNSLSGTLLFHGQNLRNASGFNPSTVVHSGAKSTTNPTGLPDTSTGVLNMMSILKSTYASSNIQGVQSIANLISTATGGLTTFGTSMISAQLGGSAVSTGGGGVIASVNTSCKTLKDTGTNTDGAYTIDPDGTWWNPAFSIYCDMTTDGGGWSLVYKNQGSTGLSFNVMTAQGAVSCLGNTTNNCSAKLDDTVINSLKSSSSDAIWYRTSSPSISEKYFWPGACVYRHDSYGNSFGTHPTSSFCTRYTATYTTSTTPTYIQCVLWGGHWAGLNAWYGCAGNSGNYTNVSITHRWYTEVWWMTSNSAWSPLWSSDTTYGNSTYMWVR